MGSADFYQFQCSTKIVFNPGLARDFSAELASLGVSSLFVITDPGLTRAGLVEPILEGVRRAGVEIVGLFGQVPANSELKVVKQCADLAKEKSAGGLLAIGGGSVLDTAKVVDVLLTHGGDLVNDYSGAETLPGPLLPLIAIPTTAGTGSEVTHAAVILDAEHQTKLSFTDHHLAPHLAILDPELTLGLPPLMTAATAMDALTHAIESFTSQQANPVSESFVLRAIPLLRKNILQAVLHGENLEARGALMTAATLAGIAFDHAMVGVVHGLSHALGGLAHVHHGTANSIFLPCGMEYNAAVSEGRYAEIAGLLGVKTSGMSSQQACQAAIEAVRRLQRELYQACGLPYRLRDVNVPESLLGALAEGAVQDGTSFYNPREVVAEEVLDYIKKVY